MRSLSFGVLSVVLGALVAVQGLIQLATDAVCPAEFLSATLVRGHSCYEINYVEKTWEEARKDCHDRNGRLATITDADLQDALSSNISQIWRINNGVWLGLNDRSNEGVFVWDDYGDNHEHQGSYRNWADKYPTEGQLSGDCVHMRRNFAWRWAEAVCASSFYKHSFICEYRMTNATATITLRSSSTKLHVIKNCTIASTSCLSTDDLGDLMLSTAANSIVRETDYTYFTESEKFHIVVLLSTGAALVFAILLAADIALRVRQRLQRSKKSKDTKGTSMNCFKFLNAYFPADEKLTRREAHQDLEISYSQDTGVVISNTYTEVGAPGFDTSTIKDRQSVAESRDGDTSDGYEEPFTLQPTAVAPVKHSDPYEQYANIDNDRQDELQRFVSGEATVSTTFHTPLSLPSKPQQQWPMHDDYEPIEPLVPVFEML